MDDTLSNAGPTRIWVVSDGRRGIENQALGLAEAVERRGDQGVEIHKVVVRKDGYVTLPDSPPPDIWIGCGRAAVALVRKHRQIFPACFFVYVQDPRTQYNEFDLIIAPEHDRLQRSNAIAMLGSPNRITPAQLDTARQDFHTQIEALPEPRAAVLIGGKSKRFDMNGDIQDYVLRRLEQLHEQGVSLMITLSRRTPAAVARRVRETFKGREGVWFFDGEGENPYFAFLAAADWIFVTEESTNMLVEAAATGRPVYALPMAGERTKDFQLLRVDRKMQDKIRGSAVDSAQQEVAHLEHKVDALGSAHAKRVDEYKRQLLKLKRAIGDKEAEMGSLQAQVEVLEQSVSERQAIADVQGTGSAGAGDDDAALRFRDVQLQAKLASVAKVQTREIALLQDELHRLRRRTYPTFSAAT